MTCRICMEPDNLVSICGCQGTMEFVHKECIRKWHEVSNATKCELCRQPFRMTFRKKEKDEDLCGITVWLCIGSVLALTHAFMLWRQIKHYSTDIYGTFLLSVMATGGYALIFALLKYYHRLFRLSAIVMWVTFFFTTSIALQSAEVGFNHEGLIISYILVVSVFIAGLFYIYLES